MKKLIVGIVRTADPLSVCGEWYRQEIAFLRGLSGVSLVETDDVIGSAAVAAAVCGAFTAARVDLTILMCCRLVGDGCVVEPFMRSGQELAVWCLPEPVKTGPLLLNSMTCANLYMSAAKLFSSADSGKQAGWLYGTPDDPLMKDRLQVMLDALYARKNLRGAVLMQIGQTSPGFVNLRCQAEEVAARWGVRIQSYSLREIFRDTEEIDEDSARELAGQLTAGAQCCTGSGQELLLTARLILSLQALRQRFQVQAFSISCWPEFQQELHVSTCLAFAKLNEAGIPVSCEGDLPGALTMLAAHYVSGKAPMLMDLSAMDYEADTILFWHCGMGLPCYADAQGFQLTKYPADSRILDLPGVCVDVKFAPQPVTICRFSGAGAEKVFVCQAMIVPGPDRSFDGARGWFSQFEMNGRPLSAPKFFNTVCTSGTPHHYVICPGHIEAQMRELSTRCGAEIMKAAQ